MDPGARRPVSGRVCILRAGRPIKREAASPTLRPSSSTGARSRGAGRRPRASTCTPPGSPVGRAVRAHEVRHDFELSPDPVHDDVRGADVADGAPGNCGAQGPTHPEANRVGGGSGVRGLLLARSWSCLGTSATSLLRSADTIGGCSPWSSASSSPWSWSGSCAELLGRRQPSRSAARGASRPLPGHARGRTTAPDQPQNPERPPSVRGLRRRERTTGLEPATPSLGSWCSTN
jgi:hypothetical protein